MLSLVLKFSFFWNICFVAAIKYDTVYYSFGENLGATIKNRILGTLRKIETVQVLEYSESTEDALNSSSLVLSLGNSTLSNYYISLQSVEDEGFALLVDSYTHGSTLISSNGHPMKYSTKSFALNLNDVHYGAAVGAYASLELLGFRFLHPLSPYTPLQLSISDEVKNGQLTIENPYWPKRTWHIHTMHPLEFTEVLNGYDIPMFADTDESSHKECGTNMHCERWEDMYNTLPGLFEWLLANKQNRVEVLLLGNKKWDAWDDLTTGKKRQDRLKMINALAHQYGLLMGADIPLALMQQHGWAMINVRDNITQQRKDIEDRVNWAFEADYDFITTEAGLSEFTKPSCDLMLELFEIYTNQVTNKWKREALTKVHCSTDLTCTDVDANGEWKYPDPRTGEPINFNFLPTYASAGLGILPHTVQVYSFEDPTAGAYGNANFSYMLDYMVYEASAGKREVVYYGESAYWVNVDVDVPLFLPLHGQRRLKDLRRTARMEKENNFRITGQMNFESGWEFGYYLSNAITARSVWNPRMEIEDDWEAFEAILSPLLSIFGDYSDKVVDAMVKLTRSQQDLLIYGEINNQKSLDLTKLSGHAYLSGTDTWVDIPRALNMSFTQPDKVHLNEPADPLWDSALEMIKELEKVFTVHSHQFNAIYEDAKSTLNDENALQYLQEFSDCVHILSLRAKFNHLLYESQDLATDESTQTLLLASSRLLLQDTQVVIDRRVGHFRVPFERIAGWRQGPTVYPFGYVWPARSLYFWWRDQGIAENKTELASSLCYLNRMEDLELVFGWGKVALEALRIMLKKSGDSYAKQMIADCLAPPLREMKFPRDL